MTPTIIPITTPVAMQGHIIHYDDLTRCGLLHDDTGKAVYFRREQVAGDGVIGRQQRVSLVKSAENVLTILRLPDQAVPAGAPAPIQSANLSDYSVIADWPNWLGGFTAVVAALVLWLAGRDITWASHQKTPSLANSWWGIGAGSLLIYQAVNYVAAVPARTLHSTAWVVVFCSIGFQSCNEFQTKTLLDWYDILVVTTLIMAYVLPLFKRS
ncbi:MAG: hypothetical protein H7Z72_18105 [Bacteroidetes bacterium]|nr:hypothetical protein [Fibrella sp.]